MGELLLGVLAWPLALVGSALVVVGALGMVRLPDLYTRLHASSLTDTGGTILLVAAMLLHAVFVYQSPLVALKLLLVLAFTLYTAPTASHALAKTALLSGHVPVAADGTPLLDSPEAARRIARSRPDPVDADGADADDAPSGTPPGPEAADRAGAAPGRGA